MQGRKLSGQEPSELEGICVERIQSWRGRAVDCWPLPHVTGMGWGGVATLNRVAGARVV